MYSVFPDPRSKKGLFEKYSKSFQTGISDRGKHKNPKSFQTGIPDRGKHKNPQSFQTRIPDRRKRKKSKVFSDEDFRQGET